MKMLQQIDELWLALMCSDVAQAGLGGCPFAPDAPGNLAADAMHQFFEQQNIATGLHGDALASLRTAFHNTMLGGQTHAGTIHRK